MHATHCMIVGNIAISGKYHGASSWSIDLDFSLRSAWLASLPIFIGNNCETLTLRARLHGRVFDASQKPDPFQERNPIRPSSRESPSSATRIQIDILGLGHSTTSLPHLLVRTLIRSSAHSWLSFARPLTHSLVCSLTRSSACSYARTARSFARTVHSIVCSALYSVKRKVI